jgi:hypothetical protein
MMRINLKDVESATNIYEAIVLGCSSLDGGGYYGCARHKQEYPHEAGKSDWSTAYDLRVFLGPNSDYELQKDVRSTLVKIIEHECAH